MSERGLGRPRPAAGWFAVALASAFCAAAIAGPVSARAQTEDVPGVRDVPSGDGTLEGVVRHPDGPEKAGGLPVALYALDADGTPSLRSTTTDASGAFRFDDIASASGVTYLVGARYRDIPYGKRVQFEADAGDHPVISIVIDVADPTADASAISVAESRVEVGWMGDSLAIQESHLLVNGSDAVVYVDPSARANTSPGFTAYLPEAASNFTPAFGSLASDFEQRPGGELHYWGSIHPGEQSVSYRYLLPAQGESVRFEARFPSGSQALTILIPVGDPEISATGVVPGVETEVSGQRFRTWVAGPLDPGSRIALQLQAPEHREDPGALEITQATAWLELDDTALTVMIEYTLSVPPGGRLVGTADSPLLQIALPTGAELLGLSPNASRLGLQRGRDGGTGIELLGPIPAGETQLSYRYRVASASNGSGTRLDLRFPRRLPVLKVLIADTGVVVEDNRMHLRRPTRVGTRLYLHREAFQVAPGETISLLLTPLSSRGLSPSFALAPVLLGAALAVWFMVAPLRLGNTPPEISAAALSARERRESIYDAIRDLDHDFETGKVSQADHAEMRAELRGQAVELMRVETSGAPAAPAETTAPTETPVTPAATTPTSIAAGELGFCTACGGRLDPSWAFCAHCGAARAKLGAAEA